MPTPSLPLVVRSLGCMPYAPVWNAMQRFTNTRTEHSGDELWLLEHEPVFTLGQAGKPEHLLAPGDIPVVPVDRGGQVTYHGPGQLVGYLLFDIGRMGMGSREMVTRIERALVGLLASYGVVAAARSDAPGVYVGEAKIASLGLRIRKGRSFHGLSLNVAMDLEPFNRINPCGYAGMAMTQLSAFHPVSTAQVMPRLTDCLRAEFPFTAVEHCCGLPVEVNT